jgi:hypothetical protein
MAGLERMTERQQVRPIMFFIAYSMQAKTTGPTTISGSAKGSTSGSRTRGKGSASAKARGGGSAKGRSKSASRKR